MLHHHAYYVEGPLALFEEYKAAVKPFWAKSYEKFGIDEARELVQLAGLRNVSEGAVFLLAAGSMTSESQNALLKLFEEPQPGTVFVLLVPHGTLLPTLRSRMLEYPGFAERSSKERSASSDAASFLKAPSKARSEQIAKLLKDDEGARERAREFVNALEAELYTAFHNSHEVEPRGNEFRQGLEDLARVRSYLGDRSPSLKMLLEHLAATLPRA